MERRRSRREPTERNVNIYSYGVLVAVGTTTDLSEHGTYICLKDDVSGGTLKPGAGAKIAFSDQACSQNCFGISVKITREGLDGVGMVFLDQATTNT